jgi:LmbE family N-acetylglucosaminyl deacetylase
MNNVRNGKTQTLVFIGAHPDDETFGIGGTLAKYAAAGIKVYYVCATRGEVGEADPQFRRDFTSVGEMRWAELQCAAQALGLTDVIYLGYRDSGMPGTANNQHPDALVMAPAEQIVERMVKAIRDLKPQVVVTFDPIGGYYHPDHIATHNAAVKAFHAAGDPHLYPLSGPAFQPSKLYFSVFSHRLLKLMIKIMPLLGRNPRKFGRNQDIDLTKLIEVEYPIHASIRLSKSDLETRNKAMQCHASQLGGGPPRRGIIGFFSGLFGQSDNYMQAFPPPAGKRKEADLFAGLDKKS